MKRVFFKNADNKVIFTHEVKHGGFAFCVEKAFSAYLEGVKEPTERQDKLRLVNSVETVNV
jgi:hypothetical protein